MIPASYKPVADIVKKEQVLQRAIPNPFPL